MMGKVIEQVRQRDFERRMRVDRERLRKALLANVAWHMRAGGVAGLVFAAVAACYAVWGPM